MRPALPHRMQNRTRRGPNHKAPHAPDRSRDSRVLLTPSAYPPLAPQHLAAGRKRFLAARPANRRESARGGGRGFSPHPPASTPTSFTRLSLMNSKKMPIEFEPPPTHAIIAVGSLPSALIICARVSRPITL